MVLLLGSSLLAGTACNAITGVSNLDIGGDAEAGGSADASTDVARQRDAASGDGLAPPLSDAAREADVPCKPRSTPFTRGTVATSVANLAGVWANTPKALVADGVTSSLAFNLPDQASPLLEVRGFGFTIPPSAVISGVTARVLRFGNLVQIVDATVTLLAAAPIGDSRASAQGWPTASGPRDYGTVEDTWGAALTPAIVNAASFGFGLSVIFPMGVGGAPIAFVDEVTLSITYCE